MTASVHRLKVVGVSGSLNQPSRTTALVSALLQELAEHIAVETTLVEVATLGPGFAGAVHREQVDPRVEDALRQIENADLLVVGSPVYRASFTGLFKHLFDFVGQYELVGTPVLLAAAGGGERHALILDHQLRPLFAFFQSLTLPIGVYASDSDFTGDHITSAVLRSRITEAASRAAPLVRASSESPTPYVATW